MNLQFDWTINFPLLITLGLGIIGVFKVWLKQRDFNRDVLILLGTKVPRDARAGLLGDVEDLKEQGDLHMELIDLHQHKLGLDRRFHHRRKPPVV